MRGRPTVKGCAARSEWTTTIGAVCDQFGGSVQTGPFGSQLHASDYSNNGTPVVMPQDMVDGRIVCDKIARVSNEHVGRLVRHVLATGDIIFSRRGDVGRFAVVTPAECGWLCGTGSIRIRLNSPDITIGYVRRYLQQEWVGDWLKHHAKGVTMPNLNTDVIRALPFTYPPLAEQRQVAAILDQADELRRKRRQAVEKLNGLERAVYLEMFGDPVLNVRQWPIRKLGEVGELERGVSKHRPRNDPMLLNGPYPLIQTGDIANCDGYIRGYTSSYSEAGLRQSRLWPKGTLCITIAANIGKTGILLFDSCFPDSVVGFTPRDLITTEYVQSWMSFVQRKLEDDAPEFAQKNINLAILRELTIPVPPLELQADFASCIGEIDRLRTTYRSHLGKLDALFASLQHRAFLGELSSASDVGIAAEFALAG
jgi:type I restriction enzyme S subunit